MNMHTISPSFNTLSMIHYPEPNNENQCNHKIGSHFIVNIGNMLQILSGNQYKSTEHQVIVKKEKYSIALFFEPKIYEEIIPIDISGDVQKPIKCIDYLEQHIGNYEIQ